MREEHALIIKPIILPVIFLPNKIMQSSHWDWSKCRKEQGSLCYIKPHILLTAETGRDGTGLPADPGRREGGKREEEGC